MTSTTLPDGSPVSPDHREIDPATGMQKGYVVLSAEERAKGFVEPVRRSYVHEKCGCVTTMGKALAETYARQPEFYTGTFCVGCRNHFPVGEDGEFVWDGTDQKVGTRRSQPEPAPEPESSPVTPIPCPRCGKVPVVWRAEGQRLIGHDRNDGTSVFCEFNTVVPFRFTDDDADVIALWNDVIGGVAR